MRDVKGKLLVYDEPDAAVARNVAILDELRKSKGFSAWQEYARYLCEYDLYFLAVHVLGYWYLDEELHGREVIGFIAENWEFDQLRCLPRGHVKTRIGLTELISNTLRDPLMPQLCSSNTDSLCAEIGAAYSSALLYNPFLQEAYPDILPSKGSKCRKWGKDGYELPYKTRNSSDLEPNLLIKSVGSSITGFHPHFLLLDDLTEEHNCTDLGHAKVERFLYNCENLLIADGVSRWNCTRWAFEDPAGKAIEGELQGKQGKYRCLVKSAFVDDDPEKGLIYPYKQRGPDKQWSGENREALLRAMNSGDPEKVKFFNCQKRNNPKPSESQILRVEDIRIYTPDELPKFGKCLKVGIEITGGGLPIFNTVLDLSEKYRARMPLEKVSYTREAGVPKSDRIMAVLEPLTRTGRLAATEEMMKLKNPGTLGYELQKLGASRHDDIVDALHVVPEYLARGVKPIEGNPAHLYISVDLAYSEAKGSDYTVFMAVAVDSDYRHWVIEYERFREPSPSALAARLYEFYSRLNESAYESVRRKKKRWGFAKSYV